MAITTYRYNSGSATTNWTNPSYAWDNVNNTYADHFITKDGSWETGEWIQGTVNNAPSSGAAITKVEIGIECYLASSSYSFVTMRQIPYFNGSSMGGYHEYSPTDSEAFYWADVTNDTNAPSTWSWANVQALDLRTYGKNTSTTAVLNIKIDQLYLRVTTSSNAPIAQKLHYRKSSATTNINIYSTSVGITTYMLVRVSGVTRYVPISSNLSHANATSLRIRKGGVTYTVLSAM